MVNTMFNVNKFLHTSINTSNKQRIKKQNFGHKNEHPFRQPTQPKTSFHCSHRKTSKPSTHPIAHIAPPQHVFGAISRQ
jgi:hypothetical protein